MSKQYDYQSGFDPSSSTQITAVQLLQLVNQITPLSNIGGIIYQNSEPVIADNPRFSRYVWLDSTTLPPIAKVYQNSLVGWVPLNVAANSVVNTSIAKGSVTPIKMAGDSNASHAYYILRQSSDGTTIEVVDLLTAIGAGSGIGSAVLNWLAGKTTGGGATIGGSSSQKVFSWDGTNLALVDPAFALANIVVGAASANQVPACIGGVWTPKDVADLLAVGSVGLNKIITAGGTSKYIGSDGSGNTSWLSSPFNKFSATLVFTALSTSAGYQTLPHGLTGLTNAPQLVHARLRVGASGLAAAGYVSGDEIDINSLVFIGATDGSKARGYPALAISSDATNVTVTRVAGVDTPCVYCIPHKTTGAITDITASINMLIPVVNCYALA